MLIGQFYWGVADVELASYDVGDEAGAVFVSMAMCVAICVNGTGFVDGVVVDTALLCDALVHDGTLVQPRLAGA